MLKLGASQPWQDALEVLTGERKMNAEAILKFFDPLYQYLQEVNFNNGETVGWS